MLGFVGVSRAFRPFKSRKGRLTRADLRKRCEEARLDLRALYRALDETGLLVNVPREARAVGELDADLAEALWVLDPTVPASVGEAGFRHPTVGSAPACAPYELVPQGRGAATRQV